MTLATPEKTDLTCQELVELVTDYLEGELSSGDRLDFERHPVWCSFCRDYLDQMRATIELTGATEDVVPPSPLREQLLRLNGRFAGLVRTQLLEEELETITTSGEETPG